MKEIALLLDTFGPYGVAALAIGYGILERRERQDIQKKFEQYAETLPKELLAIVREHHGAISRWTETARALLSERRGAE